MAAASSLKACYLTYFSSPPSDRILYRIIRKHKVQHILEFGVGTCQRAIRMIEMAQRYSPDKQVAYTGIDLFESRASSDGPGVSLKLAYRTLGATKAKIQLIPGDPFSALARTANGLTNTDLVVISARQHSQSIERAWFYLPRVIHAGSHVFREQQLSLGKTAMHLLEAAEITRLAHAATPRRAAA